jgi:hypothetical protein
MDVINKSSWLISRRLQLIQISRSLYSPRREKFNLLDIFLPLFFSVLIATRFWIMEVTYYYNVRVVRSYFFLSKEHTKLDNDRRRCVFLLVLRNLNARLKRGRDYQYFFLSEFKDWLKLLWLFEQGEERESERTHTSDEKNLFKEALDVSRIGISNHISHFLNACLIQHKKYEIHA